MKVGPQKFCLAFVGELENQLFIKKTVEVGNKKCKNLNIYTVVFFFFFYKKERKTPGDIFFFFFSKKKKTWRYHYFTPVYQIL